MILLILASLVFIALLVFSFLKHPKKLLILSVCVILLIVCNFANEIQASWEHETPAVKSLQDNTKQHVNVLNKWEQLRLNNISSDSTLGDLIEEEKEMVNLLMRRWEDRQYGLIHFQNLHNDRLRLVLEIMFYRVNLTSQSHLLEFYKLDYKNQHCNLNCLEQTFKDSSLARYRILVVQNVQKSKQLNSLNTIYIKHNLTIIFQNPPTFFDVSPISRYTYKYPFSNNYLPKLLEHHPSKTIQYCSAYHTFDYNFYLASQTIPLIELCSRPLPSTSTTKCIKKLIKDEKEKIPLGWARRCIELGNSEGLIEQNGWVSLKKEYFWSGRVNRTEHALLDKMEL